MPKYSISTQRVSEFTIRCVWNLFLVCALVGRVCALVGRVCALVGRIFIIDEKTDFWRRRGPQQILICKFKPIQYPIMVRTAQSKSVNQVSDIVRISLDQENQHLKMAARTISEAGTTVNKVRCQRQ